MTNKYFFAILNIVQYEEEIDINTIITSKKAIIETSRKFVSENNFKSLNMRTIAKICNISVASIYYYFPSKNSLMIAIIEDIWKIIFHSCKDSTIGNNFLDYIKNLFDSVKKGIDNYSDFFIVHSLNFNDLDKKEAKNVMENYIDHIKDNLLNILQSDVNIKKIFSNDFTELQFVDFIFNNLLILFLNKDQSCETLLKVVEHIIY